VVFSHLEDFASEFTGFLTEKSIQIWVAIALLLLSGQLENFVLQVIYS